MVDILVLLLVWTLVLYVMHRLAHTIPVLQRLHNAHHKTIKKNNKSKWHWNNLFLYNDNWPSTADLWISDVIPTIVVAAIFNAWWILGIYYIWAAFFQEQLEHNTRINFYPFTFGRWHMMHHTTPTCNYGLFFPLWDKIFRTEHAVK